MDQTGIYTKTAAGSDELKTRAHGLSMRLRAILIMVDGTRTVAQLREAAAGLGAPPDCLDTLLAAGLVAVRPPVPAVQPVPVASASPSAGGSGAERFVAAQKDMVERAVDAMGMRSFFFTLKLEKCYTTDDLRALLPELIKSVAKARGDAFALAVSQRVSSMLG